ncbi:helix-turn-helix domain-containing protein [Streptomyces mexicanus]|uniref:Helix-turn-helix domain-containing protein n=1 Tax=Streptomyces mexicanus TaxID=178566 RepID=A0A7X1I7P3_9ACTN|nr:helix-turn-helix domain-containing protein [Streptomyces mexicanus]MBC2869871.1 helix-turn-helix domain-containing protein [Streptomyces mexicanus]
MPTFGYLISERPELRLRFLNPAHARLYANVRVNEVAVVPLTQPAVRPNAALEPGALALVGLTSELNQHGAAALEQLLRYLKRCRASGLVLQALGHVPHVPPAIRTLAEQLQLPLLITTADTQWQGVNEHLQQQRALMAERQVEQLDGLLSSLPSQLANPHAADRIVSWLATALDADVVVHSDGRGLLASAPETSSNLARAAVLSTPSPDGVQHRIVQIHGTEDETVLAIGSHRPFDETAGRLIQHAAKVLGLCEQARRDHHAAVLAPRAVSQAATQLLLTGQVVTGQVIAGTISRELMDTDEVIVRIIDTGAQEREPTLELCERALHGKALVSPCPGKDRQIIVITPTARDEVVEPDLRRIVGSREWLLMGESTPYALEASGAGYTEAAEAVRHAARAPERIAVGAEPKFAPLLPRREAQAWAKSLLAPLLGKPEHETLLHTLPTGLSFKGTEAAKGLQIHRNTLRNRLDRAASLLGLDFDRLNDRVLVLLALNILALPAPEDDVADVQAPALADLMAGPEVKEWAQHRLRALQADHRDLLETVRVWLQRDLSVKETARALGLSASTVRARTARASQLLGVDATTEFVSVHDTDVVSIADIYIASYLLTGTPELKDAPAPS